jgi:nicotinamidase-related amidase
VTEEEQAIVSQLTPISGEVWLHKQRFSAFYETGLEMALRSAGVEALVVCGVASYGCIYMTCLDATFRGFFAFVPDEATAGENPVLHQAAMTMIGSKNIIDVPMVERAWAKAEAAGMFTSKAVA